MSESIVTTEWHSAFDYDNTQAVYYSGNNQTVFRYDGVIYWLISANGGRTTDEYDSFTISVPFSALYYYDPYTAQWVDTGETIDFPFVDQYGYELLSCQVIAQSWNEEELGSTFYSREYFDIRMIPAPVGNSFDSIFLVSPLDAVIVVLPVVLGVMTGYIALRKGIGFVRSMISRG